LHALSRKVAVRRVCSFAFSSQLFGGATKWKIGLAIS